MSCWIWLEIDTGGPRPAQVIESMSFATSTINLKIYAGWQAGKVVGVVNRRIQELLRQDPSDPYTVARLRELRDHLADHPRALLQVNE